MAWASSAVVDCEDGDVSMIVPPFSKSLFFSIVLHGAASLSIGLWGMAHSGHTCRNAKEKTKACAGIRKSKLFPRILRTFVLSQALSLGRAILLRKPG